MDEKRPSRYGFRDVMRMWTAGVFLVFLWSTFAATIHRLPQTWAWIGLTALVAFVTAYIVQLAGVNRSYLRAHRDLYGVGWVVFGVAMTVAVAPAAGDTSLILLVYVAALAAGMMTTRAALVTVVVLFVAAIVAGHTIPGWTTEGVELAIVLATAASWAFRRQEIARLAEIAAERELGELAVDHERTRIGQDLHDILGHSLTVIAIKSELAGKLLDQDPQRARTEITEIQRLARDALADVRATTHALQGRSLPTEIATARQALDSAGIEARLPTVTEDVPSQQRELFAWTVREAVTNVIRHSGATTCTVEVGPGRVSISDNGRGVTGTGEGGAGLAGLRRRAAEAGGTVTTESVPDHGFTVTVEVPS